MLTWVDFWVGLGIVSWLVGDVWERVSPLNVAARSLDGVLARRAVQPFGYPARLGQWPGVALLLVWSWLELIWGPAKEPRMLALLLLAYIVATLIGCALFGAEAWLGNVELFSVFARTLSRFSPLELRPFVPEEWASTPADERHARLRPYGAGLRTDPGLPAGGGAFVLAALATVVFDGWSQTDRFGSFQQWFYDRWSYLAVHTGVLQTLSMLAVVSPSSAHTSDHPRRCRCVCTDVDSDRSRLFRGALLRVSADRGPGHTRRDRRSVRPQLEPGGLGEYELWKGIAPAALVWWIEIVLIVGGHVAGVFAAHRQALRRTDRRARCGRGAPLVGLMVLYTVAGLWVLAQQLKA